MRESLFDCPAEDGLQGRITGVHMARQLLLDVRDRMHWHSGLLRVRDTMRDAAAEMDLSAPDPSRSSAAYRFMGIMAHLVVLASRRVDIDKLLREELEHAERDRVSVEAYFQQRRQEFVDRMAAAKARKRLARAQGDAA